MTSRLSTLFAALALVTLPACSGEVIVPWQVKGIFIANQSPQFGAQVGATFHQGESAGSEVLAREGACVLFRAEFAATAEVQTVDVGLLRVTSGQTTFLSAFDDDGYEFSEQGNLFEPGDDITFHIDGNEDFAPLSVTLEAPPNPTITPPPATIDVTQDLTFTWTSEPGKGTVTLILGTYWPSVQSGSSTAHHSKDVINCNADVSEGTVTVPASLLEQLSASPANGAQAPSVSAEVSHSEVHEDEDARVRFSVSGNPISTTGEVYLFDVTLE